VLGPDFSELPSNVSEGIRCLLGYTTLPTTQCYGPVGGTAFWYLTGTCFRYLSILLTLKHFPLRSASGSFFVLVTSAFCVPVITWTLQSPLVMGGYVEKAIMGNSFLHTFITIGLSGSAVALLFFGEMMTDPPTIRVAGSTIRYTRVKGGDVGDSSKATANWRRGGSAVAGAAVLSVASEAPNSGNQISAGSSSSSTIDWQQPDRRREDKGRQPAGLTSSEVILPVPAGIEGLATNIGKILASEPDTPGTTTTTTTAASAKDAEDSSSVNLLPPTSTNQPAAVSS